MSKILQVTVSLRDLKSYIVNTFIYSLGLLVGWSSNGHWYNAIEIFVGLVVLGVLERWFIKRGRHDNKLQYRIMNAVNTLTFVILAFAFHQQHNRAFTVVCILSAWMCSVLLALSLAYDE